MPLTDTSVRNAKPGPKARKVADGGGLYLLVQPSGSKLWRLKYRFAGVEKVLAIGQYPEVALRKARRQRDEARELLAAGVDPSAAKRAKRLAERHGAKNSFEALAREWMQQQEGKWTDRHRARVARRLEVNVFPWLGRRAISEITARELLAVLRRIESRGVVETTHRALQNCSSVFRYAVATGRAESDPSGALRGALKTVRERHYASITDPAAIGGLLRAIDGYSGDHVTRCALRLAPLVFVRPGELRAAEWAEIDTEAEEWRIAAERMKMRAPHIVPLSRQALAVIADLRPLTGNGRYLFPGLRSPKRPMSENTVNAALRRMGYAKDEMTGHGFRSMASTLLNEMGWNRDAIERQLAHSERDAVRAAYNYAEHLPERRRMMQAWADYLDSLRGGGERVTPLHHARRQGAR